MKNTALAKARITACRLWPAATSAILSLVPVERPKLGTLAVDKHWRLYFDAEYLATVKPETAAVLVLHEVSHLLLRHHVRGGNATDWPLWNVATDCAINYRLQAEGHVVPPEWQTPARYQLPGNLTAEQYYRHLQEQRDAQAQQQQQSEGEAEEDDEQDEAAGPAPEEEPDDQSGSEAAEQDAAADAGAEGDGADGDQGSADPGSSDDPSAADSEESTDGDCGSAGAPAESLAPPDHSLQPGESGSCADGQLRPWEEPAPEAEGEGTPAIAPHEQEQLIRRVAEAIENSGKGSGGWSSFVQNILHPKIDPKTLLTMAIRQAVDQVSGGHDDTTYRRPSRRQSIGGVIRPSRVALIPRICVIVDSSGSMSQKDLGLALGLVSKVLSGFRLRDGIHVVVGDVCAQSAQKVFDASKIAIVGRGGTDVGAIMEEAYETATPKPQLVIAVTDGETPWPNKPLPVPVVACLTRDVRESRRPPAWIRTIQLVP